MAIPLALFVQHAPGGSPKTPLCTLSRPLVNVSFRLHGDRAEGERGPPPSRDVLSACCRCRQWCLPVPPRSLQHSNPTAGSKAKPSWGLLWRGELTHNKLTDFIGDPAPWSVGSRRSGGRGFEEGRGGGSGFRKTGAENSSC